MQANWQIEFPDFPPAGVPILGDDWTDISWRNDACPSFRSERAGLVLFVDHPDLAEREFGADRYSLFDADGFDEGGDPLVSSEDWTEVEAAIAGREAEWRA